MAVCIFLLLALLFPSTGWPLIEAPHNRENNISCGNCHGSGIANSPFWGTNGDGAFNNFCYTVCHKRVIGRFVENDAPLVKTHSSTTTNSSRATWGFQCITCHYPHSHQQSNWTSRKNDGALLYLASGTLGSPGPYDSEYGTTTFPILSISYKNSNWADDDPSPHPLKQKTSLYRGAILIPNELYPQYNYAIYDMAADGGSVTLRGNLTNAAWVPYVGYYPFKIIYGQFVRTLIDKNKTPGDMSDDLAVRFYDQTGTGSFADGDATRDGICEVCHTQTNHFRSDGSGPDQLHANIGGGQGSNCTRNCHKHENGFAHGGGRGGGSGNGCSNGAGCHQEQKSHPAHLALSGVTCLTCHQQDNFPNFTDGGTTQYTTTVCATCHTDGTGAVVPPPVWGSSPAKCSACHAVTPTTGSHTKHLVTTGFKKPVCGDCHDSAVQSTSAPELHLNNKIDVYDVSAGDLGYPQDKTIGTAYAVCSAAYCHSSGQSADGQSDTPVYAAPTWGGTAVCGSCHKTTTETPLGQIDTGSHSKHLAQSWISCDSCHYGTGSGTSYNSTDHVNKLINVQNSGGTLGYTLGGTPGNGYGTCSIAACHSSGTPQWGGAAMTCESCHLVGNDVDDYTFNNGSLASINSTEWSYSGHGKTSGTYDISGNPAANLPGAAGSASSCLYCHKSDVAHDTASNPFRLVNNNVLGNGWNDNCLICHGSSASGYDPDGAGSMNLKTATVKINKKHYGAAHSSANDGGSLCWDCHDPHGDRTSGGGNIYMIHNAVVYDKTDIYGRPAATAATAFTAHGNASDYVRTVAPFNGICQVCHGRKDANDIKFWRADGTATSHNADKPCKECHAHSSGFQAGCNGCHGNPPVGDTTKVFYPTATGSATAGAHNKHLNSTITTNITCGNCHVTTGMYVGADGVTLNSKYNDGLQIGISTPGYAQGYTTLYDGQSSVDTANGGTGYQGTNHTKVTTNGSQVCSNVYCHSSGISLRLDCKTSLPSTSPAWNWDGVNTAGDPQGDNQKCNNCHGFRKVNEPPPGNIMHSGRHANHVGTWNFPCYYCHADTAAAGVSADEVVISSSGKANHINGVVEIKAGGILVTGPPVTITYNKTTRTCTNVSCHNASSAIWTTTVQNDPETCPDVCATGEKGTPVVNKDPVIVPMTNPPSPVDMFIYANDPNTLHYVIRAYDPDANDPIAKSCLGGSGHGGENAFIRTSVGDGTQCVNFISSNLKNDTPSALEVTCRFTDTKLAASPNRCFTYAIADNDPSSYNRLVGYNWNPPDGVSNDGLAEPASTQCMNPTVTPANIIDDPYNNIKVEVVGDTLASQVNASVVGKTVSLTFTARDADQVDPVKQAYWQAKYPTKTGGHSADSTHYVQINWASEGLTTETQAPTNPAALQLTAAGGTKTYYFNFNNVDGETPTDIGTNDGAAVTTRNGAAGTAKGKSGVWIQAYICDNHMLGTDSNMLKDCYDTGWFYVDFPVTDPTTPTVTAFTVTTPSNSLNIPVTSVTATDDIAVTGYQITTSATPPSASNGLWSGTAPATYTVGADGVYKLYPWAKDADGKVSAGFGTPRTVVVDTIPPSVPAGLTGVTVTATSVALSWTASTDSSSGLAGYKIERAPDNSGSPGSYSQVNTSVSNSYADSGLSANTKYWYRVRAYDNAGNNSGYATEISKRTLPSNPTATNATDGPYTDKIVVSWSSGGLQSGYRVYRDGDSGSGTQVYDGTATTFDDTITGFHSYYVYSKNEDGVLSSGYSSDSGSTLSLVYYSVGQNTTDHKTGTPSMDISSGTATFSVAQTATNMGVGDRVTYNSSSVAYISGKISTTQWNLITATGAVPTDVSGATVNSITHEYASLAAAIAGASDANHINTTNLTSTNTALNIPCYYDTGADTATVTVSGFTTGINNYIRIYTPTNQNTEVNQNQRHGGQWDPNKYNVQRTSEWVSGIAISDAYVRIEGIQVYANSAHSNGISYTGSGEFQASANIIKGGSGNTYRVFATYNAANGAVAKLWNNIAYDMGNFVYNDYNSTATHVLYNNTAVNTAGIFLQNGSSMTVYMKNNLVQGATGNYTISGPVVTTANNISQDGTSPDTSYRNRVVSFVDSPNKNFHVSGADTAAREAGVDLSANPNLAFNTDIDGQARPYGSGWDIGADQTGLVGFWSFDNADVNMGSNIAYDRSGQGNNGTLYNATQTTGKIGQAFNFNGTYGYIAVTENSSLPIYNQNTYSISMWVNGPANQVDKRIFSEGHNTNLNPIVDIGTAVSGDSGKLDAFLRNDSGTILLAHVQSVTTVFDGTWHHIVWTDNNGTVTLYVDGVADGTNFNYAHSALTLNRTAMGAMLRGGPEYFFNGAIDEVRFYRRVLSLQEVQDLYQAAQ